MAKKKKAMKIEITNAAMFLVGLVFVIESLTLMSVLTSLESMILGTTITIGWLYSFLKLFAGAVSIYSSIKK